MIVQICNIHMFCSVCIILICLLLSEFWPSHCSKIEKKGNKQQQRDGQNETMKITRRKHTHKNSIIQIDSQEEKTKKNSSQQMIRFVIFPLMLRSVIVCAAAFLISTTESIAIGLHDSTQHKPNTRAAHRPINEWAIEWHIPVSLSLSLSLSNRVIAQTQSW